MAPRRGMFVSNKVKPFANKDKKFNSDKKTFKPKDSSDDKKADFFVRPGTSGSTQTKEYSKKNKSVPSTAGKTEKKPFDKKKWRLQRYSNKYKVQQWEDRRKKVVMREYYKQIDDRPKFDVKKIYESAEAEGDDQEGEENQDDNTIAASLNDIQFNDTHEEIEVEDDRPKNSSFRKKKAHLKVQKEFERMKEEKLKNKEDAQKKKEERVELLKAKKEERLNKYKRLNKKTKKGQPIMKDRMEMLLEQIQKNLQK